MNRKRKIVLWAMALVVLLGAIWQWGIPRTQHVTKSFQMVVLDDTQGQANWQGKVLKEGELYPVHVDVTKKTFLWFRPSITGEFVVGEKIYAIQPTSAEHREGIMSFSIRPKNADPSSMEFEFVYANRDFSAVMITTVMGMMAGPANTYEEGNRKFSQVMFPGLKLME